MSVEVDTLELDVFEVSPQPYSRTYDERKLRVTTRVIIL